MIHLTGYIFWISCLLSVVLHELAHVAMAWVHGLRVKKIGLSWKGPYIVRECGGPIANLHVSLAGPMVNLLMVFTY